MGQTRLRERAARLEAAIMPGGELDQRLTASENHAANLEAAIDALRDLYELETDALRARLDAIDDTLGPAVPVYRVDPPGYLCVHCQDKRGAAAKAAVHSGNEIGVCGCGTATRWRTA